LSESNLVHDETNEQQANMGQLALGLALNLDCPLVLDDILSRSSTIETIKPKHTRGTQCRRATERSSRATKLSAARLKHFCEGPCYLGGPLIASRDCDTTATRQVASQQLKKKGRMHKHTNALLKTEELGQIQETHHTDDKLVIAMQSDMSFDHLHKLIDRLRTSLGGPSNALQICQIYRRIASGQAAEHGPGNLSKLAPSRKPRMDEKHCLAPQLNG